MTTLADELREAAFLLRNLIRRPELAAAVDLPYTEPLAELLEEHGAFASLFGQLWVARTGSAPAESDHSAETRKALAVARAINRDQP